MHPPYALSKSPKRRGLTQANRRVICLDNVHQGNLCADYVILLSISPIPSSVLNGVLPHHISAYYMAVRLDPRPRVNRYEIYLRIFDGHIEYFYAIPI